MRPESYIKYRLFHLIKDVTENSETKRETKKETIVYNSSITKRTLFGLITYITEINNWSYTVSKENVSKE